MDFNGKRILITGGSRGIGRAAAEVFLEAGARVALNGRTAASTADGIAALGGGPDLFAAPGDVAKAADCEGIVGAAVAALGGGPDLFAAPGDVAKAADCEGIVGAAVAALGGLDVLVNSAGIGDSRPLAQCDEAMWDATMDVNLKGTFFCIRAAHPHLERSGGNIVNIASDAGLIGEKGLSVYCASKGGVVNLTRALALELAPKVRVNCVCPGYVDTDMVRRDGIEQADDPAAAEQRLIAYAPLRRIARPVEIGRAIAYLASDDAAFVTGAALQIDGGTTAGHG